MKKIIYAAIIVFSIIQSCKSDKKKTTEKKPEKVPKPKIETPEFNDDSAYCFIEKQVSFGPRVPETEAHEKCKNYLTQKFEEFLGTKSIVQEGKVRLFNNKVITAKNIIASYKPNDNNRIFLAAHWDSRPFADHDPDKRNFNKPIDGANDGASGVGVLLEIARTIGKVKPQIGIDFILFDVEDYGKPESLQGKEDDTWCLGSQFWAKTPHKTNYFARYGILLDMVGAKNAKFPMEYFSNFYAPDILKKVWGKAHKIGYGNYFLYENGGAITDDHIYINKIAQIPTIDIVHLDNEGSSGFFEHWHTVNDNMYNIDKKTLQAVGQTLLEVIYNEPF